MRFGLKLAFAGLALAALAVSAAADELGVGSKAPKLDVVKWVQGKPIDLGDGKTVHVIEFWATW